MSVMATTGVVVLAAVCMLCFMSVGFVEQNEYGLVYNWMTKQIGTKVVHGGTHLIGFWNSFVTFPATVRTIEFSERVGLRTAEPLSTRTKEGLGLHLSISFQYLLEKEKIPELYALTNIAYEGLFTRIARDQLLEAAAEYEGPQYWLQRRHIGAHMRRLVDSKLKESHSLLWGLQLLTIDLPDRYEKSITMTQVQNQIIRTRRSQQFAASIRADTEVMRAGYTRDISIVRADAQANFTLATKLALAEAARRKIAAEAEAIQYARGKLGLSAHGAVEYQEMSAYGQLENATFLANVPNMMPMMGIGGAQSLLQQPPPAQPRPTFAPTTTAAPVSNDDVTGFQPNPNRGYGVSLRGKSSEQRDQSPDANMEREAKAVRDFFNENAPSPDAF